MLWTVGGTIIGEVSGSLVEDAFEMFSRASAQQSCVCGMLVDKQSTMCSENVFTFLRAHHIRVHVWIMQVFGLANFGKNYGLLALGPGLTGAKQICVMIKMFLCCCVRN